MWNHTSYVYYFLANDGYSSAKSWLNIYNFSERQISTWNLMEITFHEYFLTLTIIPPLRVYPIPSRKLGFLQTESKLQVPPMRVWFASTKYTHTIHYRRVYVTVAQRSATAAIEDTRESPSRAVKETRH